MPFRVPRWFVLHAFAWAFAVVGASRVSASAIQTDASEPETITHWPMPAFVSTPAPPREPSSSKSTPAIGDAGPGTHASATLTFRLEHGFDAPFGKPNAWVYVPTAYDPRAPLHVVVIFHGFKNCIDSYVSPHGLACNPGGGDTRTGYDLPRQMEHAGSGAILVVPEIAYASTSSDPGRLGEPGEFRAFMNELLGALGPTIGKHRVEDVDRMALMASSGGYQALEPILDHGGIEPTELYLLDAFYLYPDSAIGRFLSKDPKRFDPLAKHPRRFGLLYSRKGGAMPQSEALRAKARDWLHESDEDALGNFEPSGELPKIDELTPPVYVLKVILMHDHIVERYFWQMIRAGKI
ncbi:hypothetical protein BH09MYX1_BH09MYX1_18620 [soil metagenome]